MQKNLAGIFALIWILAATAQPDEHYCNTRFGFCVDVPAPLKSAGEGENGDGSKFYVPGKAVEVIASIMPGALKTISSIRCILPIHVKKKRE